MSLLLKNDYDRKDRDTALTEHDKFTFFFMEEYNENENQNYIGAYHHSGGDR